MTTTIPTPKTFSYSATMETCLLLKLSLIKMILQSRSSHSRKLLSKTTCMSWPKAIRRLNCTYGSSQMIMLWFASESKLHRKRKIHIYHIDLHHCQGQKREKGSSTHDLWDTEAYLQISFWNQEPSVQGWDCFQPGTGFHQCHSHLLSTLPLSPMLLSYPSQVIGSENS